MMNLRMKIKSPQLFVKLFLSYVLSILIPLVILFSIFFFIFFNILSAGVARNNVYLLNLARDTIDTELSNLNLLAYRLSNDLYIRDFMFLKPRDQFELVENVNEAYKSFKKYDVSRELFYSTSVYFYNSDVFLDFNTYYTSNEYKSRIGNLIEPGYDQWIENIKSSKTKNFIQSTNSDSKGAQGKAKYHLLTYACPLPQYSTNIQAVFIALIDMQKVIDMINSKSSINAGHVMIYTENSKLIYSSFKFADNFDGTVIKPKDGNGYTNTTIDKKSYIAVFSKSNTVNLQYVFLIPKSVITNQMALILRLFSIVVFLCIVIGLYLAFCQSKRNYEPIKNILKVIESSEQQCNNKQGEYTIILDTIKNIFKNNSQLKLKIEEQAAQLKNRFIAQLLKESMIDRHEAEEFIELYNIAFPHPCFVVSMLSIPDFSGLTGSPSRAEARIAYYTSMHVISEIIGEKQIIHYIADFEGQRSALLANIPASYNIRELVDILDFAQSKLEKDCAIHINIGLGQEVHGIGSIHQSYQSALSALNYCLQTNSKGILKFDEVKIQAKGFYYPTDKEVQIINSVKTGNTEVVRHLLKEIFETNTRAIGLEASFTRLLFSNLICTANKVLSEISGPENILWKELSQLSFINSTDNNDVFSRIESLFIKMCDNIKSGYERRNSLILDKVLNYIHGNYSDCRLSLNTIADMFNIQYHQLCRLFKEKTGYNYVDYMNRYRLSIAKNMLENGQTNISVISSKIGYTNPNTFIRTFKKYYSVTPGNYRKAESTLFLLSDKLLEH